MLRFGNRAAKFPDNMLYDPPLSVADIELRSSVCTARSSTNPKEPPMYLVTVEVPNGPTYQQRTVDAVYSAQLLMDCAAFDGYFGIVSVDVREV